MVSLKVFAEGVTKEIKEYLSPAYTNVECKVIEKRENNGHFSVGVAIIRAGENSAPIISMEPFYEAVRNPTYMGYMAYGKSFSNNYLEQKRVNNHNSDTYMYVKADFEPIVTEEEWHRCEAIRKSRRRELNIPVKRKTLFGEESVTSPRRESHDKWNRKLRCACGSRLRKNRWHKNKNKEWSYGYECYNQINNGSAKKRREQGLDDTGFCEVQMVADWKLEVMCKMLLERIWQDKKTVIRDACSILKKCYQADVENEEECFAIQKKIAKIKPKIDNLIDLRTEGDISKEEYRDRRKKLDMELTEHENQLLEQQAMKKTNP